MDSQIRQGVLFAIGAYFLWGIAPVYFKQLAMISAQEILTHRIVWSVAVLFGLVWILRIQKTLFATFKHPKRIIILLIAGLLLATNWLIYIWSVNAGRILEASLGYYINPLLNVLLGGVVLGERLRPLQLVAVGLACLGVAILLIGFGEFPWIAISLACSFSLYGLLRKMVQVDPVVGLSIETLFMFPAALVYLLFFASPHSNLVSNSIWMNTLLISSGLLTTIPLLFFTAAAKRLQYSTLGFLQYLAPSLMFAIAVSVYDELFTLEDAVIFSLVWAGVLLYCADSFRAYRLLKSTS